MGVSRRACAAALVFSSVWAAGCEGAPTVRRVYDGQAVDGRFIEPEAYAAFLGGALAESTGDMAGAIGAYERAARLDPHGPEVWARIAFTRCTANPHDWRAAEALRRAIAEGPRYAPAWEAVVRCAVGRGDMDLADRAAAYAWELRRGAPPRGLGRGSPFAGLAAGEGRDYAARDAIARSAALGADPAAAAEALARWAQDHDHAALWARALEVQLAANPSGRANLAALVPELARLGRWVEARAVAAAVADVSDVPLACSACDLARRLAVDDAIDRRDDAGARRRAARVRVPLEEVAGRWLLAGNTERARAVAREVIEADPGALGAALVLDAILGRDARAHANTAGAPASAASWIAWGLAIARRTSAEAARAALASVPHEPIVPGDERVAQGAVDLGLRDVAPGER